MKSSSGQLSCDQARQIDLIGYLADLGYQPKKIRGNNYWFLSPLRREKTASFKVDGQRNQWYDFAQGAGGNFIDFGILYYQCSVAELLVMLREEPLPQTRPPLIAPLPSNKITIIEVRTLLHPALLAYCSARGIASKVARWYCSEAEFILNGKRYFSIGFRNRMGGFELRNRYFKGGSSPKAFTLFQNGNSTLAVFEGFFDFLSYQMIRNSRDFSTTDFLVLNSLSFFESALPVMENYSEVNLFLDNNAAGKKCTQKALAIHQRFKDQSFLYNDFEDLNDYLCSLCNGQGMQDQNILKPP